MVYKRRFAEDDLLAESSINKNLPTEIQLNYDRVIKENKDYNKILKKLVKHFSSDSLIQELKRRKLVSFNWDNNKWEKTK